MAESLKQRLAGFNDRFAARELDAFLAALTDRLTNVVFSTTGLVIKTSGSAIVKAGSALYGSVRGQKVYKASSTDMAALSGTVTNAKFNVFMFFIDAAGTLSSAMGTEGATFSAVKFPTIPTDKAVIGFVIINPTGTGNFVGGTTPLDDATVTPNAVYVNTPGAFVPDAVSAL